MKTFFGLVLSGLLMVSAIGCGGSTGVETPENPEAVPTSDPGGEGGADEGETAPEATVPPGQ